MSKILDLINPVNALVWITFIIGIIYLNQKKTINRWLLFILSVCTVSEVLAVAFLINNISIGKLYSVYFILFHFGWLVLLKKTNHYGVKFSFVIIAFLLFSLLDLFYLEVDSFSSLTYVVGALTYVTFFIYESYSQLNHENLNFFKTKEYLISFAPILSFLLFSVIFSFKSRPLNNTLFLNVELYDIVCNLVNYLLYCIIIYYIYDEYKTTRSTL